jgi:hypothetical protein
MNWKTILKNEDEMKNEFFKVIRREYDDMGWAKEDEFGKPTDYSQEGYSDFLIEDFESQLKDGVDIVDIIISEIKENEIVMNSVKKDDPERAKNIQDFIDELKALMA